eukprot:g4172.t1
MASLVDPELLPPLVTVAELSSSSPSLSRSRKLLIVVVHLIDPPGDDEEHADLAILAVAQSHCAIANGADGLFLIPAVGGLAQEVVSDVYVRVRSAVGPEVFVGVNRMSNEAVMEAAGPPHGANALWTDSGVDLHGTAADATAIAAAASAADKAGSGRPPWLWFAGFLFKGKARTFEDGSSPAERSRAVAEAVTHLRRLGRDAQQPGKGGSGGGGGGGNDGSGSACPPTTNGRIVLCTSGPGTGSPFEADRAKLYRACVGEDVAIAVASGVTAENVEELLPYVDVFMVATGVEAEPEDPDV